MTVAKYSLSSVLGIALVEVVVGQESIADKSNEITAVPKVLDCLDLTGATVSLDAMGGQHEIATQIANKGGFYFLAIKGNQL